MKRRWSKREASKREIESQNGCMDDVARLTLQWSWAAGPFGIKDTLSKFSQTVFEHSLWIVYLKFEIALFELRILLSYFHVNYYIYFTFVISSQIIFIRYFIRLTLRTLYELPYWSCFRIIYFKCSSYETSFRLLKFHIITMIFYRLPINEIDRKLFYQFFFEF